MTANVKIEIAKRTDVLRVPNAALRFRPTPELFAALNQAVPAEAHGRGGQSRTRRPGARLGTGQARLAQGAAAERQAQGRAPRPAPVAAPAPQRRRVRTWQRRRRRRRGAGGGGSRRTVRGGSWRRRRRRANVDPAQMMERFKTHVAGGAAAVHRAHEGARPGHERLRMPRSGAAPSRAGAGNSPRKPRRRAGRGETIDALFAPLPTVETPRPRVALHEPRS